nr:MAG TPA: protein of unknown function (DUF4868) [Caudoviricetes sp.]
MDTFITEVIKQLDNIKMQNKKLFFVQKSRTGYTSYAPNVTPAIYEDLLNLIKNNLENYKDHEIVMFNPIGYRDMTIEQCKVDEIGGYQDIIKSFENPDNVDTSIRPAALSFYCLAFSDLQNSIDIKFFRRITKFKKLSSQGIFAWFSGETLNRIEQEIIGIDGFVDIICINNQVVYVLNHIALERVFDLAAQFDEKAHEAIEALREIGKIKNFDQFEDDCLNDKRFIKILSKLSKDNTNFESAFSNFQNIREVIDLFELEIDIIEGKDPMLRYEGKYQLMDFLRIIQDSYYKSLIRERAGIDNGV